MKNKRENPSYFIIFINFGLDVSAVKNVSINRSDNEKLSEVVSSVLIIKAFLFILSFLALGVLLLCVKQFRDNYVLFLLSFLSCLSEILTPFLRVLTGWGYGSHPDKVLPVPRC